MLSIRLGSRELGKRSTSQDSVVTTSHYLRATRRTKSSSCVVLMPLRDGCALPQELVDHTIDFLHNDKSALAACSLVCCAWVWPSRSHLFRSVHISYLQYHRKRHSKARTLLEPSSLLDGGPLDGMSSDRDDRGEVQFPDLVASFIQFATTAPTSVISNIRHLALSGARDKAFNGNYVRLPLGHIETIMRLLPALCSLTLTRLHLDWDRGSLPALPNTFSLRSLTWKCPDDNSPSCCLITLLSMFPGLEELNWHSFALHRAFAPVSPRSLLEQLSKTSFWHNLTRLSVSPAGRPDMLLMDVLGTAFPGSRETFVTQLEVEMSLTVGVSFLDASRVQALVHTFHSTLEVLIVKLSDSRFDQLRTSVCPIQKHLVVALTISHQGVHLGCRRAKPSASCGSMCLRTGSGRRTSGRASIASRACF